MTPYVILGRDENGHPIKIEVTETANTDEQGNPLYNLSVDSAVTIDPGDITIASVTLKDGVAATLVKVAANTSIVIGNNAVSTHDAQVGQVGQTPADGTVIGLLDSLFPVVSLGVAGVPFHSADQSGSAVAVTDAPTAGKKLVITDLIISAGAAMVVTLSEETSGAVLMKLDMAINSTVVINPRGRFTVPTADKKLLVRTSASGNVDVWAQYYSA